MIHLLNIGINSDTPIECEVYLSEGTKTDTVIQTECRQFSWESWSSLNHKLHSQQNVNICLLRK